MKRTIIIAEAGVNHNGSYELAKQLVDAAADAGADFVKFQSFKADKLVSKYALKADYQKRNTNEADDSQYSMLKRLEMPEQWHYDLIDYCGFKGIKFLSTGFDIESIDFLEEIGTSLYKIPSGEITNKPYLEHVAEKGRPMIISTGMATLDEIRVAVNVCIQKGMSKEQITILHCNTEYPTPMLDVNLLAMNTIAKELEIQVGYSDHTLGIEIPIAAVALGAKVIEKHFTLDKNMEGPDHIASLDPQELKLMIQSIRNVEAALSGSGLKEPSDSEKKNIPIARKSIVAKEEIAQGELLTEMNITTKRPGTGLSPMFWDDVIGTPAKQSYSVDDFIEL